MLEEFERWGGKRLKEAALRASQSAGFWRTPSGGEFLRQLDRFVGSSVAGQVRGTLGYSIEAADITHTIVVQLSEQRSLVEGLRRAVDPWGYLARCARGWGWGQASHRMLALDALLDVSLPGESVEEIVIPSHGLTRMDEVIECTVKTVLGYVRNWAIGAAMVRDAVGWFAANPPQHQGHGHIDARRAGEFKAWGFSVGQVGALANVTWGGRPNMHQTSLFYGFLLDSGFAPEASRTHRVALANFQRTFLSDTAAKKGIRA